MTLQTMVVGCGAVAQRLYRIPLQQLEKRGILQVASLIDPVATHRDALGKFFPDAARHGDLADAPADVPADLTLVLSPAHLHCEQVIQALRRNSHVLCEKPMAHSAGDCARMNGVAAETGRILAIGMLRRFFPSFGQFRALVAEGRLGALRSFEYREGHKFEWEVTTPAAFRPRKDGGTGVLFDIGPHVLDHLAWTFGDLHVVNCADDALGGIESNASIDVMSAACPGVIHLSWDAPQLNELRVFGSKGEAVLRIDRFDQLAVNTRGAYEPQKVTLSYPGDLSRSGGSTVDVRSYPEAVYCQLVQMARAIVLGEAPAVTGESGRRCVTALDSALSMARPLTAPWLDPAEQRASAQLHWNSTPCQI